MRRTLTWRLGLIIVGVIFATMIINAFTTYKTAYENLYMAAGVEAYGCANITTGLLDEEDIMNLANGTNGEEIGEKLNWTVEHKDIFENQYIVNLDGEILALDDNLENQGYKIGDDFYIDEQAIQELVDMKHSTYSEIYEFGGMERISGYAPIFAEHDAGNEVIAISVIDFNADIVSERTWTVVKDGVLLGLIPLILAAVVTLFIIRRSTKPISALIEQTSQVADGDIREHEPVAAGKNEVGDLASHLNQMTENLREMIITIKKTAQELAQNTNYTSTSMNEMKIALSQISGSMEEVASGTSDGAMMTKEASEVLDDLAGLIRSSSEKAEKMVKSATYTMETAEKGLEKVNEVAQQMDGIKESSSITKEMMRNLNEYTTEVHKITESITSIADQTNLLALNAAIEAARAGEHGKGFAVVADEVRKLAEQSSQEASEVEKIISKITENVQKTLVSTEESYQRVETGEQSVQETGAVLEGIRAAVNNIVNEINQLSMMTDEEAEISNQIVDKVHHLQQANENMASTAQEVSAATEESSASIENVADRASNLEDMSTELNDIVNKFKLN